MAIHSNETAGAYWTYDVGGPGTWYWDTTHYPSGAYWLQEFTYVTPGVVENPKQYPPVEISSVIIQVTVNNGFAVINENGTDTFAKVEAPTAGSNFKYQGTYTFSTDNQISWTRFDACETYDVNVMFQQEDNDAQYPSAVQYGITTFNMPLVIGKVSTPIQSKSELWQSFEPPGQYTAETWSDGPQSNQALQAVTVAHGVNTFNITN